MVDFCMCMGKDCYVKNDCYRYKALKSTRQTYFSESPVQENGICNFFVPIETFYQVENEE